MLNLKSLVVMTVQSKLCEPVQFSENLSYICMTFSNGKFSIMETSLYFDAMPVCISKRVIINQQTTIKYSKREPLDDATY